MKEATRLILTTVHTHTHTYTHIHTRTQSTFPIKLCHNNFDLLVTLILFYQPEENPTLDQVLEKSVQCFLCLIVTISNCERELT